jgi:type II secretory pathway pseudopilin PulG
VNHQAFYRLRNSAFTLLDLLTALGLFAAMAAIAIPNLAAQLPTYRLNAAARQVQSELHRIKSQAVANNTNFRVVFLNPSLYRIERMSGSYQPTGEEKALPDGIIYGHGSAADISYTPRGTSNSQTIKLCNSRREGKSVIVFGGTGRIRVVSDPC